MRGNPHVRFLEGKMAVMSSSYSTCTSVRKACAAERRLSIPRITPPAARRGTGRISPRKRSVRLHRRVKGYAWTGGGMGVLESVGTDKSYASSYGSHAAPTREPIPCSPMQRAKARTGAASTRSRRSSAGAAQGRARGLLCRKRRGREWKSFADGCVKTKVAGRGWTSWYRLPFLDYGDGVLQGSTDDETPAETPLGSRLLMDGSEGSDVRALQEMLLSLGYELPRYGADGDFGAETEAHSAPFRPTRGWRRTASTGKRATPR